MARFREYLDREDGLSVRGRWRLTSTSGMGIASAGYNQSARVGSSQRHDVRRNTDRGNGGRGPRGQEQRAEAARGRGRAMLVHEGAVVLLHEGAVVAILLHC